MADLIRPEVLALLRRWGEVLAALALAGFGLWWALTSFGLISGLGWALTATGAALGWGALQRARFASDGEGPGLVEVDEGEIRHFGPRGGGIVSLDSIAALVLSADARFWLVETLEGHVLALPRDARGAEALFDAFATLPGLDVAHLVRVAAQGAAPRARPIWRRTVKHLDLSPP